MTPQLDQLSLQDQKNLLEMKRQLRRLKRRLFLQAVKKPETSVDKFRAMILNFALDDSLTAEMTSMDSNSSLPSIDPIYEEEVRICEPVG
mmetsp:Transcript_14260/g.23613  ORF Transcript_14260/g.23613 Transcript_14260/m.23613 type:complete len:90 (-) Transcript_14260:368-637(-)|eukprot:CAMPEP_0119013842 /NCGR_PEP_ID=MMETSP1176-20130426/9087_1 /TAXON_ID=265551 /ORGANISM="Synedropsis recta cf, Strain CCMP1620" /LENGTH=89 /DNA_ID=CAMNT_0006966963 /DNA_START=79 /DNA_END=351 /DNA_ORIENTATION=-